LRFCSINARSRRGEIVAETVAAHRPNWVCGFPLKMRGASGCDRRITAYVRLRGEESRTGVPIGVRPARRDERPRSEFIVTEQ
jgi:hypothetical protein